MGRRRGVKKDCSMQDCNHVHYAKGLCKRHYYREYYRLNLRKRSMSGDSRKKQVLLPEEVSETDGSRSAAAAIRKPARFAPELTAERQRLAARLSSWQRQSVGS